MKKRQAWKLVCIGSFGDVLLASGFVHQLRALCQSEEILFYVGSCYRIVLDGNSELDGIIEVSCRGKDEIISAREMALREAKRGSGIVIDFFLDSVSENTSNLSQTRRMLDVAKAQGAPNLGSLRPHIQVSKSDESRACDFLQNRRIAPADKLIIAEYRCESFQSVIGQRLEAARNWINTLVERSSCEYKWILSARPDTPLPCPEAERIFDGAELNYLETAALMAKAYGFLGVGSGLTVLSTSDYVVQRNPHLRRVVVGKPNDRRGDIGPCGSCLVPSEHYRYLDGPDLESIIEATLSTLE